MTSELVTQEVPRVPPESFPVRGGRRRLGLRLPGFERWLRGRRCLGSPGRRCRGRRRPVCRTTAAAQERELLKAKRGRATSRVVFQARVIASTRPCAVAPATRCLLQGYTGSLTVPPAGSPRAAEIARPRQKENPFTLRERSRSSGCVLPPVRVLQLYRVASSGGASHVGCSDHRGVARRRGAARASHPCLDGRRRDVQAARRRGHVVGAAPLLRRAADRPGRRRSGAVPRPEPSSPRSLAGASWATSSRRAARA